jgi:hypothetical protein
LYQRQNFEKSSRQTAQRGYYRREKKDGFDTKRLCINEKNKNITIYESDKNIFDMFFEDDN